jgi:hypothetical protein
MDAVEFLDKVDRLSKRGSTEEKMRYNDYRTAGDNVGAVKFVERWDAEHPVKTRQSEFLKMFPNVILNDKGQPSLCAKLLDTTYHRVGGCGLDVDTCQRCMDNFWGQEVEE